MIQTMQEKSVWNKPGLFGILICLGLLAVGVYCFLSSGHQGNEVLLFPGVFFVFLMVIAMNGFVIIQPQETSVIQFFGSYMGTIKEPGLRWTIPFSTKMAVSMRLRNFESPRLKVNEKDGNPIEIAAIVVWKVVDSAQAMFSVNSLEKFVEKQTESALRFLATKHPYDKHDGQALSLHEDVDEVNEQLRISVSQSLQNVGVQIIEARISHLAYAPEIAAAMLQRQQAQAIIAARSKIVDGAVGMVDMALKQLQKNGIVQLDEERKAAMISNLLVVLCSERPTQPIVNTGSIY